MTRRARASKLCMDLISPDALPPGKILGIIVLLQIMQRVGKWLRRMQQRQRINRREQDILRIETDPAI